MPKKQSGIHGLMTPELVREYAKKGMTLSQIGNLYSCTHKNIAHAIESRDDLKQAWNEGHTELLVELVGHLKERCFKNDTILMFTLKTLFGFCEEQYRIGKQLENIEQPTIHIYLPDNGRDSPAIEVSPETIENKVKQFELTC